MQEIQCTRASVPAQMANEVETALCYCRPEGNITAGGGGEREGHPALALPSLIVQLLLEVMRGTARQGDLAFPNELIASPASADASVN